jgi:hypothetical protein
LYVISEIGCDWYLQYGVSRQTLWRGSFEGASRFVTEREAEEAKWTRADADLFEVITEAAAKHRSLLGANRFVRNS